MLSTLRLFRLTKRDTRHHSATVNESAEKTLKQTIAATVRNANQPHPRPPLKSQIYDHLQ